MTLYLVVPCFNEEEGIEKNSKKLFDKLKELIELDVVDRDSKIVLVNDGSSDKTKEILNKLHNDNSVYRVINFVSNYGHQNAVMAGYLYAVDKCDACISIDADLQQDIDAIPKFIEKYKQGYDVVYGVRNDRSTDGAFKKLTSQMFYGLMMRMGCNIIPNHADYRLVSNKVLRAISEIREHFIFLRGMIPDLGFKSDIVYFDVKERDAGSSKYTVKKMINLAINGIVSYSDKAPLLIGELGFFINTIGLIGLIVFSILSMKGKAFGLAILGSLALLLSGVTLIALAFIGEYVIKTLFEVKNRPRYIIDEIWE